MGYLICKVQLEIKQGRSNSAKQVQLQPGLLPLPDTVHTLVDQRWSVVSVFDHGAPYLCSDGAIVLTTLPACIIRSGDEDLPVLDAVPNEQRCSVALCSDAAVYAGMVLKVKRLTSIRLGCARVRGAGPGLVAIHRSPDEVPTCTRGWSLLHLAARPLGTPVDRDRRFWFVVTDFWP
jgi:hypothetical protein